MGVREEHERMVEDAILMRELRRGDKQKFKKRDGTEMFVLTQKDVLDLTDSQDFLNCLESCGVDTWDGYDDACDMFNEGDS